MHFSDILEIFSLDMGQISSNFLKKAFATAQHQSAKGDVIRIGTKALEQRLAFLVFFSLLWMDFPNLSQKDSSFEKFDHVIKEMYFVTPNSSF